jgi:hypothetical protein
MCVHLYSSLWANSVKKRNIFTCLMKWFEIQPSTGKLKNYFRVMGDLFFSGIQVLYLNQNCIIFQVLHQTSFQRHEMFVAVVTLIAHVQESAFSYYWVQETKKYCLGLTSSDIKSKSNFEKIDHLFRRLKWEQMRQTVQQSNMHIFPPLYEWKYDD